MADRINAQQVHEQFLIVLEKLSTLKPSKAFHQAVTDFVIKTESNIERTNSGDSKALDEARNSIRWMEALYHSAPSNVRMKTSPLATSNLPKNTLDLWPLFSPQLVGKGIGL